MMMRRNSSRFSAARLPLGRSPRAHSCAAVNSILRGRDASYLAPPAQIRTCGFPAYGSHLGYQRQFGAVDEPTSCATLTRLGVRRVLRPLLCSTVIVLVTRILFSFEGAVTRL